MDERNSPQYGGPKVSEIANLFTCKILKQVEMVPPRKENNELGAESRHGGVSEFSTNSHVARFNSARALFEKLGATNLCIDNENTQPSTDIEARPCIRSSHIHCDINYFSSDEPSNIQNVIKGNTKDNNLETNVKKVEKVKIEKNQLSRPVISKKPELLVKKCVRRELIDKQKNWMSHFSKSHCTNSYGSTKEHVYIQPGENELEIGNYKAFLRIQK